MDTNTTLIVILIVLVVVAVLAVFRFRQRTTVHIKGPFGTGLDVEGSNETPASAPGVSLQDIKSRKGGLRLDDETGDSLSAKGIEVEKDVDFRRRGAQTQDPKELPPV